jgi:hypothetical protein
MNILLTHIPLLLTYFHLYSRKHVLQDTSPKQVENTQNKEESAMQNTYFRNVQRRIRREAHLSNYLDQSIDVEEAQAQPLAHLPKAWPAEPGRVGMAAPPLARPGPILLWRLHAAM